MNQLVGVARRSLFVAVVIGAITTNHRAQADDKAAAAAAFTRAKELAKQGNFVEACPLFEVSLRADWQLGALLNLADCHESLGRTATAWAEFNEAEEQARKRADARAAYAKQRADALWPRLSKLRITTANPSGGFVVRRDNTDVTATIGQEIPVNPGEVVLVASAPDRQDYRRVVTVANTPATVVVDIPTLEAVVVAKPPPPAVVPTTQPVASPPQDRVARVEPPIDPARRKRHRIALAIGGTGLAAVGVALGFGFNARSAINESTSGAMAPCDAGNVCNKQGEALVARAHSSARLANFVGAFGVGALLAGVVVWITAPSQRHLEVAPSHNGVVVTGRF